MGLEHPVGASHGDRFSCDTFLPASSKDVSVSLCAFRALTDTVPHGDIARQDIQPEVCVGHH